MCKGRFNTQPPEGGWSSIRANLSDLPTVSTRSRPKAAGAASSAMAAFSKGFNTQPPEGGWLINISYFKLLRYVSTRSRPKAAGYSCY